MANNIVQLKDKDGNKIFPVAISDISVKDVLSQPSDITYVDTQNIVDGAVTSDKIDLATLKTTLYHNETPNSTPTQYALSESAANFDHVIIYGRHNGAATWGRFSTVVAHDETGYSHSVCYWGRANTGLMGIYGMKFSFSSDGTKINIDDGQAINIRSSGVTGFSDTNELLITEVIGYK